MFGQTLFGLGDGVANCSVSDKSRAVLLPRLCSMAGHCWQMQQKGKMGRPFNQRAASRQHPADAPAGRWMAKLLRPGIKSPSYQLTGDACITERLGHPSIDPELMVHMLLSGHCQGIRSERRLCEEIHAKLAYRWFCKLDLADPLPDHSTFSKNRHGRFCKSGFSRHLFKTALQRCMHEGLVGGHNFDVDASPIPANANQTHGVESKVRLPGT